MTLDYPNTGQFRTGSLRDKGRMPVLSACVTDEQTWLLEQVAVRKYRIALDHCTVCGLLVVRHPLDCWFVPTVECWAVAIPLFREYRIVTYNGVVVNLLYRRWGFRWHPC